MRTPDTSPARLTRIRGMRDHFGNWPISVLSAAATDLLAMVDALEAQVRDLTKPEEEFQPLHLNQWAKTKPDIDCPRCYGCGYWQKDVQGANGMSEAIAYYHCARCDPMGKIPFPTISDANRAADQTEP